MRRKLKEPFGKAGLIVAVVALVFAMLGGAYAATGASNGPKATASAKAKQGKQGKPGKPGPAGPQGPAGPAGAKGDAGAAGANGTNGSPGANGVSPVGTSFTTSKGGCLEGGVEYKGATTNFVCKGEAGEKGEEGSPWTVGGTLPAGATETGAWSFQVSPSESEGVAVISYPILLPAPALGEAEVHYSTEANFADFDESGPSKLGCVGVSGVPKAPPGHLCVYQTIVIGASFHAVRKLNNGANGSNRSGALVTFNIEEPEPAEAIGSGSFAVTAACESGQQAVAEEEAGVVTGFTCQPAP